MIAVLGCLLLATTAMAAATGWTGPRLVGPAAACSGVVAAIEALGRYDVAAACGGRIRVSSSHPDGSWATTYFSVPPQSADEGPQVALDGNRLYVAYTRDVLHGCGPNVAAVYYRSRNTTGGQWEPAVRVGQTGDVLQSFRVVGAKVHATITGADGATYYETYKGGTLARYLLSDAQGASSLRIGSDGRARIAYQGASTLRYAVFNGSGFTKSSIPGTNARDIDPQLVLDGHNGAHVAWSHVRRAGPGCVGAPDTEVSGTYYATNTTGSWTASTSRRITTDLGPTSLTLDTTSGQVHVVVGGASGLRYFTKSPGGTWSGQTLTAALVSSTAIKLDPASGTLLAVYARQPGPRVSASIFAFTKP